MMNDNGTPLKITKEFCLAWLKGQDVNHAVQNCSKDVVFAGARDCDCMQGKQAFRNYLRQSMAERPHCRFVSFAAENERFLSADTAIVMLELALKEKEHVFRLRGSFTLTLEEEQWLVRQIDSAPISPYSADKLDITREELLSSSVAGGLMGGYVEKNFPFYYVNQRMLSHLGYDSEEDFVRDIGGYVINCIHPDDQKAVDDAVAEQLANRDEYTVEYRMRKKDGSYIFVHDMGRVILTEEGRQAILSVCTDITKQQFERQQNESIIKALNGSTLIGAFREGKAEITYISPNFGSMVGYSRGMVAEIARRNFLDEIHPLDRERFMADQRRAGSTSDSVEGTYRALHQNGEYVWIMAICRRVGEKNGAPLLHYVFASRSKQFELQDKILSEIDTGIIAIDPTDYSICLANEAAFKIMERPVCDYYGRKCYEVLGGFTQPCPHCTLHMESSSQQEIYHSHLDKTLSLTTRDAVWMGKAVWIQCLNDITKQKRIQQELELGEQRLTAAIRHAQLQFWEYDIQHDRAYMSAFSQQSYGVPAVMEQFPESFLALGLVYEEDEEAFRQLHKKLKQGVENAALEYRVSRSEQEYHWQQVRYTAVRDENGMPLRAFATAELADRLKTTEEELETAANMAGARIWSIHMQNRTICFSTTGDGNKAGKTFPCGTQDEFGRAVMIAPEDVPASWQQLTELFEGKDSVTFKARLKTGEKYRWHQVSHTALRTKSGIPVRIVGVSIDIHEHVLLEQRFEQEMEYSSQLQAANLITKVRCNITNGTVDLYDGTNNTSVTITGASYDEGTENLALTAVEPEKQDEIRYYLNRERVQKAYTEGENSYDITYLRRGIDRTVFWAHTVVKTYMDPATDELMSFMYTFDINEQKLAETVMNRVVDTNFEYLTLFNAYTGVVERTIDKAGAVYKPVEGYTYEESAKVGLKAMLIEKDFETYFPLFKLENITRQLERNGTYSYSFDLLEPGHEQPGHKLWVFNWFDEQHSKILCSRSDITEIYRQEQRQKEALSAALAEAEQANTAKSDFLSRMSHDIRTPMNAIMGLTALASAHLDDQIWMEDFLQRISISSKHLLSLINDVLDMSRIERGQISLNRVQLTIPELAKQLSVMMEPQTKAANLQLTVRTKDVSHPAFFGDSLRVNEILINLLSNAVKFTREGGRVDFLVEEISPVQNSTQVRYRFTVSDTGIGMKKEFLNKIFEPFARDDSVMNVEGTGLGLSIVQGLVDLMEGEISAESQPGEGSIFKVELEFEAVQDTHRSNSEELADSSNIKNGDGFAGRRFLIAEDNSLNAEILCEILQSYGAEPVVKQDGVQAVKAFGEAVPGTYDAILMDIQMPNMNGYEASRAIRTLERTDAKEIPIIALTANAFAEDIQTAADAGMTAHVAKPIDVAVLRATLSRILSRNDRQK